MKNLSNRFAEVISIGDELTNGQRLDTNSQWLSLQLGELGLTVRAHQTIGDYLEPMQAAFRTAAARAHVVLVTGGLGPTQDDLTRQALAEAFGAPLYFHEPSWEGIRQFFSNRNLVPPESNRLQAMFPSGSEPIPNAHGTAPGIQWTLDSNDHKTTFFCLPGVPVEMREMYLASVRPVLEQQLGGQRQFIVQRVIKTFGAGESQVESLLPNLVMRGNDPQVGITASQATISLRLQTTAATPELGEDKLRPVLQTIQQCLGSLIFGEGDVELEDVVIEQIEKRQQRLVVVEWGTRGLVAQRLDEASARRQLGRRSDKTMFSGAVIVTHRDAALRWLAPDVTYSNFETLDIGRILRDLARVAADRFQANLAVVSGPLPDTSNAAEASFQLATLMKVIREPCSSDDRPLANAALHPAPAGVAEPGEAGTWLQAAALPGSVAFPELTACSEMASCPESAAYQETAAQFSVLGHPSLWRPRAAKQVLNSLRLLPDPT